MSSNLKEELKQRIFQFDVEIHNFLLVLPQNNVYTSTITKLIKSSSYLGRYFENIDTDGGLSKPDLDFIFKIGIVISNIQICNYKE